MAMLREIHSKPLTTWRRVEPEGVIRAYRTLLILKHSAPVCCITPKMMTGKFPRRCPQGAALLLHNNGEGSKKP